MASGRLIFITGTDTGVGKSYATGLLARAYRELGVKVITAKPVQTGAKEPEDLLLHRRLMGFPLDPPELLDLTGPYLFSYPAAPTTAAAREGKRVELKKIRDGLRKLAQDYEIVLVEGAGGLYVPFTEEYTFLDLISLFLGPVVVVSAARLGTINHTVLTLKALRQRGLVISGLIYNRYFEKDPFLAQESLKDIKCLASVPAVLEIGDLEKGPWPLEEAISFLRSAPGLKP